MEAAAVYCDWTLLDAVGRFLIFSLWGYSMGKSVTHSAKTTWTLTFGGVLACALIHTGMQEPASGTAGDEPIYYFIKVFVFYLTASIIGYRTGCQKARKTKTELNRIQAALNMWEARGLIKKDDE